MRRRSFLAMALASAASPGGWAQKAEGFRRVGIVSLGSLDRPPLHSLVDGLRQHGWESGRNLEWIAPGPGAEYGEMPRIARAAIERKADVLVAFGTTAVAAAVKATNTVPIVMVIGTDPVALGFVKSLARPEANVTGVATNAQVLIDKRVELLREVMPRLRRVAVLWNSESAGQARSLDMLRESAKRVAIELHDVDIRGNPGKDDIALTISKARAEALVPLPSTQIRLLGPAFIALAAKLRLPAIYTDAELVAAGGLMSYSPDGREQMRRAAMYVDRLLKGARPADLPIEQPTKFELAINLKAAKAIALVVPQSVLLRADRVIE